MTKLNDSQEQLLQKVVEEREAVQSVLDELDAKHEKAKWRAKAKLVKAATAAADGGVPARRIGFAINSSDHKTIQRHTGRLNVTEVGN